jgi:hypothetical protein
MCKGKNIIKRGKKGKKKKERVKREIAREKTSY